MIYPALNETVEISVDARNPNGMSDLFLSNEHKYNLIVSPVDQLWLDGNLPPFTAAGGPVPFSIGLDSPQLRKPDSPWFSLIASIEGEQNTFTEVGLGIFSFSPTVSGELVCFANDVPGFYGLHNDGVIQLKVTRVA